MSLLDFDNDEPKCVVICVAIIGLTILGCCMFNSVQKSSEYESAFKAGYEEVRDPNSARVLWKKSGKEL